MVSIAAVNSVMVLKAAHSDLFSSGSLKAKMFIVQLDNKIIDAAEAMDR